MHISLLFDEAFSLAFMRTLLHFLWQGTFIGLLAFTLDSVLPCSARRKYLIHVAALMAMVICLPMTFSRIDSPSGDADRPQSIPPRSSPSFSPAEQRLMSVRLPFEPGEASVADQRIGEAKQATVPGEQEAELAHAEVIGAAGQVGGANGIVPADADAFTGRASPSFLAVVARIVTFAYLSVVAGMMARLMLGMWGGHKLRRSAIAIVDQELLGRLARQAKRIGLRLAPAIAYCEQISVPVVVGVLRPVILLPASLASGLSPDQLEALVTHELAHLRRFDPLVNVLQRTVESVIFFHPAVWYVSRRIDIERENASDDLVLAAGWKRVIYADALVRMAELSGQLRSQRRAASIAMLAASGSGQTDFKRRVMRLLDGNPSPLRLTRAGVATFLAVVVGLAVAPLTVQTWAQPAAVSGDGSFLAAEGEQFGRQISDFSLQDYLGTSHALSDFDQANLIVVAFLGTECPLAKLYGPQLAALAKKYEDRGVQFVGINANQQDTPTELGHYARIHGITFPLLKDPGNRIADQFRAERTPEVFVLDRQRVVRYWGRIDDQFGVGYARPAVVNDYLATAIDELLLGQAVSTRQTTSVGCHIGRVTRVAPTGEITYGKQISRIVQRRCVECHREEGIAPFALQSYEQVAAWAETMVEVVADQRMPPWHASPKFGHFANDGRMPQAEKDLLQQWVDNGVPQGSLNDLPPRREFADGWALGEPDLVLTMPEPVTIGATGVVDYQYITVDPQFTEGKWVRASEIRPGVRSVVHHILVFIEPPGGDPILKERGVGFETVGGYVPGSPPMELAEGVARYVPPGSKFVFQVHYTPNGTQQRDQSQIGLYFADPQSVRYTMQTGLAVNLDFVIPANADNHRVEATHRFSHDMEIYSLVPHMHYRGKAFRFEVTYPNGSREILLDVPRYDFNWQNTYRFAQPKLLPEGTLLKCVAHFDNSEGNLSNPDPAAEIRWGEQTWDEMMIGYFEGVFLNQDMSLGEPRISSVGGGRYRVRFAYRPDRPVKNINLAGTFNDWNSASHPFADEDGDGAYHAEAIVEQGEHRYKFVIDGNYWTHDPASRILTGFLHESFFVAGREADPQTGG